MQQQYKSIAQLKNLARSQMRGRFGILIAASLIPFLISFFMIGFVSVSNYAINYVLTFIMQVILSILNVGTSLIFIKCACNMPAQAGEIFYGYKNNTSVALKLGFLFVLIESVCYMPSEIMLVSMINSPEFVLPNIMETMTVNELMEYYPIFYATMSKYYGVVVLCTILCFLAKLAFVPAYYMMLDFPHWNARTVLKKSIEVMRGNKMRYILLQASFMPAMVFTVFTCGIALIWLIPYMSLASANFYLDIMAERNHRASNL